MYYNYNYNYYTLKIGGAGGCCCDLTHGRRADRGSKSFIWCFHRSYVVCHTAYFVSSATHGSAELADVRTGTPHGEND